MYGEIFFAALQSAAFVESDKRTLIDIALSYIPEESATAKAILKLWNATTSIRISGKPAIQIHNTAPGTFGIQSGTLSEIPVEGNEGMETGAPGFDAPENVAFTIAGWLYGGEDFGRSLCMAVLRRRYGLHMRHIRRSTGNHSRRIRPSGGMDSSP